MRARKQVGFDHTIRIDCAATKVVAAFFDPRALAAWWDVEQSVATPRPLGAYALQWAASGDEDDLLGRLGGVYHGIVMDVHPERGFFVADSYWLPPDTDPVGPMALEVTCSTVAPARGHPSDAHGTQLRIVQRGLDDSPRWLRYYEVIGAGWPKALATLKEYLEHGQGVWDLRAWE